MSIEEVEKTEDEGGAGSGVCGVTHDVTREFFRSFHRYLIRMGLPPEWLKRKTADNENPPCFGLVGASIYSWMQAASGALPRLRLDMPGEPNYCNDCTPRFQKFAHAHGACLFPHVVFEEREDCGETALVGITRAPYVVINGRNVRMSPRAQKLPRFERLPPADKT